MNRKSILIRFDGQAGDGVLSTGQMVARAAARSGYQVLTQSFFFSEVRGGASTFQVRLGCDPLLSPGERPDVVIALDKESAVRQSKTLADGGILVHSPDCTSSDFALNSTQHACAVDWKVLATEAGATPRSANVVAAGFASAIAGLSLDTVKDGVFRKFAKKPELAEPNANAAAAGYAHVKAVLNGSSEVHCLAPSKGKPLMLLSGNEAVALGALVGGIRFYAGYPITPASEVMEVMAKHLPQLGGQFIQAEDEIAALAMCVGAAYGGKPSLTATSGPGLSLMCELIGLAGISELPIVIVDVQRAGPSTGMPTKDGQGDLNLAVYGTHGDIPRAVLAAQTVADCFNESVRAVRIAHKFHVPVILLSSQAISHSQETVELPDLSKLKAFEEPFFKGEEGFVRYRASNNGEASLRSVPGTPGGMYRTGGLEHDESGNPCANPENRVRMVKRRAERLDAIASEETPCETVELPKGGKCEVAIVGWGRAASAAREALDELTMAGLSAAGFFPKMLWPLPIAQFEVLLQAGAKVLYVCETNSTGQLAQLLRAHLTTQLAAHGARVISILKDDGNPMASHEIRSQIETSLPHVHTTRTSDGSTRVPQEN